MGKEICNLTLSRESGAANQNWGFRIIGGTDQGQTYKVSHRIGKMIYILI